MYTAFGAELRTWIQTEIGTCILLMFATAFTAPFSCAHVSQLYINSPRFKNSNTLAHCDCISTTGFPQACSQSQLWQSTVTATVLLHGRVTELFVRLFATPSRWYVKLIKWKRCPQRPRHLTACSTWTSTPATHWYARRSGNSLTGFCATEMSFLGVPDELMPQKLVSVKQIRSCFIT